MPKQTAVDGFSLSLDELGWTGHDLQRPECVLCTRHGDIYVSDRRGGVTWIQPDGSQTVIVQSAGGPNPEMLVNGFALQRDGSFLVADIAGIGGVWRLGRDGELTPVLLDVDGIELKVCNYVGIDEQDRIWVSVSTRQPRRDMAYRAGLDDGFVALLDGRGARIVADGLGFTNEVRPDPTGQWVYVNETFSHRLTRFRLHPDGSLTDRETVVEFEMSTFPDGLTFDSAGGVWITGPMSNRLVRVDPDGTQQLLLEDYEPEWLDGVLKAHAAGPLGRSHLDAPRSRVLRGIASLAFGGADLRTAYMGCLLGDRLATFRSPVAGAPPPHWEFG